MVDLVAQGHANRKQGFYGECVVQAIAAAANLAVSQELLEPDEIDFEIIQKSSNRRPRRKRIELQVKTRTNIRRSSEGSLQVSLKRNAYHALNGRVGFELDIPRFLVVVPVPVHFSGYCSFEEDHVRLSHLVYWRDLMGLPDLPSNQDSVTVSVPGGNLLTPKALVGLTCGDGEEAELWMST